MIVTVDVPDTAELVAAIVNVVAFAELVGLKETVTPAGNPLAENATTPVNPFSGETVTVEFALEPGATLTVAGAAVRLKSGTAVTVSATEVV